MTDREAVMPFRSLLLVALLVVKATAADPKPRFDADGSPLPAEAVQRFGSLRFLVNDLKAAAFSPDGKVVYTISEYDDPDFRFGRFSPGLIAWVVPSGKKLWQTAADRVLNHVAADPDGEGVWALEDHPAVCSLNRVRYSTTTGKELSRIRVDYATVMALHPTGVVACLRQDAPEARTFQVWDRDGRTTETPPLDADRFDHVQSILLSPKADRLYVTAWDRDGGKGHSAAVALAAGKVLWEQEWDGRVEWQLTPDGKRLVGCRQEFAKDKKRDESVKPGSPPAACCWDADTGKEIAGLKAPGLRDFAYSFGYEDAVRGLALHAHPDGKTVFLRDKEGRTVATRPTAARLTLLTAAAILTTGRRTVANLLRTVGRLAPGHDASYRRVLSAARWSGLALGRALARHLLDHLVPAGPVYW